MATNVMQYYKYKKIIIITIKIFKLIVDYHYQTMIISEKNQSDEIK